VVYASHTVSGGPPDAAHRTASRPVGGVARRGATVVLMAVPGNASRGVIVVVVAIVTLIAGYQLGRMTAPATSAGSVPEHVHPTQVGPGTEVSGLAMSAGGYTIALEQGRFTAGVEAELRFTIDGPDGTPVTRYATVHEKEMHLIVVRRDLTGYQHLHPERDADGTWHIPLLLDEPGPWRVFADFTVLGRNDEQIALTLGVDLTVAGDYQPVELPAPDTVSTVNDFTVTYEGQPQVATSTALTFRATRGGIAARLEPYLGAYGHLVMIREGDLGYVHVHADPPARTGEARFWLTVPSPGRYRMFLDFQVTGVVRTATFVVDIA